MTRQIVTNTTPQFVIPTLVTGVPIPKSGKGRKPMALNPVLVDMPAGASFIVSGEVQCKAILGDVGRIRLARKDVQFKTRQLGGQLNTATFEPYPQHTVGVWAVAVPAPAASVANEVSPAAQESA